MVKINMCGHPNPYLTDFVDLPLQVDLTDPSLPSKLTDILRQHIGGDDPDVVLVPPGFAPLAALTIAIIHGLTGQFPRLQPLLRDANGSWVPGPVIDLTAIRGAARQARPGMVRV